MGNQQHYYWVDAYDKNGVMKEILEGGFAGSFEMLPRLFYMFLRKTGLHQFSLNDLFLV